MFLSLESPGRQTYNERGRQPPGCRFPGPCGASPKVCRGDLLRFLFLLIRAASAASVSLLRALLSFVAVAADAAPAAHLEPGHEDFKPGLLGNFPLELLKQGAAEFLDLTALEASQMHVIPFGFDLVVVLFAVHVHQIELIDKAELLQLFYGPVDGGPIDAWLSLSSQREQRRNVQMFLRFLHGLDQHSPLCGHADTFRCELFE